MWCWSNLWCRNCIRFPLFSLVGKVHIQIRELRVGLRNPTFLGRWILAFELIRFDYCIPLYINMGINIIAPIRFHRTLNRIIPNRLSTLSIWYPYWFWWCSVFNYLQLALNCWLFSRWWRIIFLDWFNRLFFNILNNIIRFFIWILISICEKLFLINLCVIFLITRSLFIFNIFDRLKINQFSLIRNFINSLTFNLSRICRNIVFIEGLWLVFLF